MIKIQFLRNEITTDGKITSRSNAVTFLEDLAAKSGNTIPDATPIVIRYTTDNKEHSLFAIKNHDNTFEVYSDEISVDSKVSSIENINSANTADIKSLSGKTITSIQGNNINVTPLQNRDGTKIIEISINTSATTLNSYTQKSESGEITSDDTINSAISKLVNNINSKQDTGDYVSGATFNSYSSDVETKLDGKVNIADFKAYSSTTDSNKLSISDFNEYSASTADILKGKQNKLEAGSGISISGNTISTTLDTTIFRFVSQLPESGIELNKVYFVPSPESGETNVYVEYAYDDTNKKWEIIGQYQPDIDLKPYLKITDFNGYSSATKQSIDAKANSADVATELDTKLDTDSFNTYSGNVATELDTKLDTSAFTEYSAATASGFSKVQKTIAASLNDLNDRKSDTGHTHTLSQITDFNGYSSTTKQSIDAKLDKSVFSTYSASTSADVATHLAAKLDTDSFSTYSGNVKTELGTKLDGSVFSAYSASTSAAIASAGKIDDVKVDGTSVVSDKTAIIDLSSYAKTSGLTKYALSADVTSELATKFDISAFTEYSAATESGYSLDQKVIAASLNDLNKRKSDTGHTHTLSQITDYKAPDLSNYLTNSAFNTYTANTSTALNGKQNTLKPGTGITISSDNTISTTLDTTIFKFVTSLPATGSSDIDSNKVYFVPSSTSGTDNVYVEYAYDSKNNKWEIIGQYQPKIDLSPYLEISDFSGYSSTTKQSIDAKLDKSAFNTYSGNIETELSDKQDKLTIDTALNETSPNLVANSAITTEIQNYMLVISSSLNDLNTRLSDLAKLVNNHISSTSGTTSGSTV